MKFKIKFTQKFQRKSSLKTLIEKSPKTVGQMTLTYRITYGLNLSALSYHRA